MNVGDLVRIRAAASDSDEYRTFPVKRMQTENDRLGIIIEEHQMIHHPIGDGGEVVRSYPHLYYAVYDFMWKGIFVYQSYEIRILNKAARGTSHIREEYQ